MQDDKINSKDEISSSSSCEENDENKNILNPPNRTKMSKGERRARKMLVKLGLKAIPNVHKVIIKKSHKMIFAVSNVEVYKVEGTESYVIFGDAKTDDIANSINSLLPDALSKDSDMPAEPEMNFETAEKPEEKVKDLDEEKVGDVSMEDVELIMSQTKCSRDKAISVLRKNNNDLVQSIMELSS
ncbi:nascent polypeptide associated complex alpha chain, putative [Plasmodium ovale wallikeri]|uniref:Nascent polypeptide associated complex alpha chain, putative n=2 Tax=Plasmodium ovale TaxID=36330 RepID=A0A1A8Z2N1_PLAOA|nr:nascent polypeptide associated complex alpha chain, putative [Plasmodium ovale wallikeri]SBT38804.1 nascent polypeptide associated complex alpha chain, putative [Plasmodium ovale wallikeri]SBT77708.1 nascent polypeptide-associated complex subunit alpha, putative [Plasmodium ovale]